MTDFLNQLHVRRAVVQREAQLAAQRATEQEAERHKLYDFFAPIYALFDELYSQGIGFEAGKLPSGEQALKQAEMCLRPQLTIAITPWLALSIGVARLVSAPHQLRFFLKVQEEPSFVTDDIHKFADRLAMIVAKYEFPKPVVLLPPPPPPTLAGRTRVIDLDDD